MEMHSELINIGWDVFITTVKWFVGYDVEWTVLVLDIGKTIMHGVFICLGANFLVVFVQDNCCFILIPRWLFMFMCSHKSIDGTLMVGNDRTPMKDCGIIIHLRTSIFNFIISIR